MARLPEVQPLGRDFLPAEFGNYFKTGVREDQRGGLGQREQPWIGYGFQFRLKGRPERDDAQRPGLPPQWAVFFRQFVFRGEEVEYRGGFKGGWANIFLELSWSARPRANNLSCAF